MHCFIMVTSFTSNHMIHKILLTKPLVKYPIQKQGKGGDVGIPLGLLYLAGYVREYNDVEVSIAPYRLNKALGVKRNLAKDFKDYDIIATGCCTSEYPDALKMMKKAKKLGKITVMGGLFPSANIEEVLKTSYVDYIIRGEGEIAFSELINALDGKISIEEVKGISYMKNNKVVHNAQQEVICNLDTLPMPAYDLIPIKKYLPFTAGAIYAARGCPMGCKFCTLNKHWQYRYRKRSIKNIIKEVLLLKDFGFKRIHFKDESMAIDKKWSMKLFKEIEKLNLGIKFKAKSRIDQLSEDLIKQMVKAGIDTVHFGVESVSQSSLNGMQKSLKKDQIRRAFNILLGNGCKANPVYMFSWIGETEKDIIENSQFIEELGKLNGVITYVSFITPHPGSNLKDENLKILSKDYARYTHKYPVAIPKSLGKNGLQLMVKHFNHIAKVTGTEKFNPIIRGGIQNGNRNKGKV